MIDSVVLANCLYDITPTSFDNIKAALENYREQRFENVKAQYAHSHRNAKLRYGHVSLSPFLLSQQSNLAERMVANSVFLFSLFSGIDAVGANC